MNDKRKAINIIENTTPRIGVPFNSYTLIP